jgi:hypothetical protein
MPVEGFRKINALFPARDAGPEIRQEGHLRMNPVRMLSCSTVAPELMDTNPAKKLTGAFEFEFLEAEALELCDIRHKTPSSKHQQSNL